MRIVITGGSGYLGSAAVPVLRARGHEVVTIGRHPGIDAAVCDLTDGEAVCRAVRAVGDCDAVVHLAARAHEFRGLKLDDLLLANTITTRNLIDALRAEGRTSAVRFVHASSVAVYELLDQTLGLTAEQVPYAASKLQAEQLLQAEPFQSLFVLRFAPIYDHAHLQDVAKRVFLPGTRLKLRLYPPPMHGLCAIDRAVDAIVDAVDAVPASSVHIGDIADSRPTSQHELASLFPGVAIPVPTVVLTSFASGIGLCGRRGRAAASFVRKFALSTTYHSDRATVPRKEGEQ